MKFNLSPAVKVAVIYAVFAAVWIIFSDLAIEALAVNKVMLSALQTWKGLCFVLLTAVLVYISARHYFHKQHGLINKLAKSEKRLSHLLNTIPDGIQENDLHGRITYSNSAHHQILGYPEGGLIGHFIWDFQTSEQSKQQLKQRFNTVISTQPHPDESLTVRCQTFDGEERLLEVTWDYLREADGSLSGMISVITDITQRQRQQQEIMQLAYYDPLTRLPNRFRSLDFLATELHRATRLKQLVSVMILDLDHFKKVNDSLGHDVGDNLLKQIARRLQSQLGDMQKLGRLGGDEFIVITRGQLTQATLNAQIEQLLTLFEIPFDIDQREILLTASVGIAMFPNDGENASELLRNADSAMFYAKDNGRNTFAFFTHAMNLDVTRRFAIEEQLRTALDKNELSMVFQPQVDLLSGKIVAAEALIRWHNPLLGTIPPDEFISVAEQSNQILAIGQFVLAMSLSVMAKIQHELDPDFRMAINLSPCQFRDLGLVTLIKNDIKQYDVRTECVELEITEGVLLAGSSLVTQALKEIHDLGVTLAMDDFGTGYSSLSYLRSYPFDVLKIDRSFVNDILNDEADGELINAIIAMSQGLGLKVVAEGVENQQQAELLQEMGCDYAQGYYFSKPLPEAEFLALLKERS